MLVQGPRIGLGRATWTGEQYLGLAESLLAESTITAMPTMSGRQLADRAASVRPGLKVLFMSGYTDDAVMRHGVEEKGM
ncbi:MAG TPA: hypothetical protein VG013_42435, partial [Gemmataceae bacterium]|nr:hypothetical protein [Gemmataceae bacterium]